MHGLIVDLQNDYKKPGLVKVRSGDTVRVTQRVREASKERLQVFEGLVIRTDRLNSLTARITVRKLTFGVGVEKSFLLHSPNVAKVEVVKRAKVRRNYLSYMRDRVGKAARLKGAGFDKAEVNRFSSSRTPFEMAGDGPAEAEAAPVEAETAAPADNAAEAAAPAKNEDEEEKTDTDQAAEVGKGEDSAAKPGAEPAADDDTDTEADTGAEPAADDDEDGESKAA